jgi:tripeptide aminopeptidase
MTENKLLEIFFELIGIDAISGSEMPVAEYISNFIKKISLDFKNGLCLSHSIDTTGNLICKVGTGGNFLLLSHMDTARSTYNVEPKINDGKITSNGTTVLGVDNRAGIASILYALLKMVENKIPLKDFTIAFTTQEETTMSGSRNLLLDEKIKMGFVFDSHMRPGNFICESCGDAGFNIKVIGKASHSGISPEKGIDSIKIASKAIASLEFGRIDPETTANIGFIKGGSAVNVVPELTEIEGEVRSMSPNKVNNRLEKIKSTFEFYAEAMKGKVDFNFQWDFKPYKILPESEVFKKISEVLLKVGLQPKSNTSWGGSDANSLNEKGIQCINLGIGAENPHSNEEFILVEDLQKASEIAMELMKK